MEKNSSRRKWMALGMVLLIIAGSLGYIMIYRRNSIMEGDYRGSMVVDGMERTYIVHPPAGHENGSMPLLIALHGGGGSATGMERLTRGKFNELADREGFVVVYPDAVDKHWNDGRNIDEYESNREDVDDVAFISAIIDRMVLDHGINPSRVYITGMSNGALMSYRLACEIPDRISAIAPVAGYVTVNLLPILPESSNISFMIIGGTDDPLIPWNGGTIHFGDRELGDVVSAEESAALWADIGNCSLEYERAYLPDKDPEDGTRIWKEGYLNPETGVEVVLYGVEGGGHTWPSGDPYLPESVIGKVSYDMDACYDIWDFFEKH